MNIQIYTLYLEKQNANFEKNEDFEINYINSLGNLVIDTKSSNSRKGNKLVEVKKGEYSKAPFMSQNEIEQADVNWSNIQEVKSFIDERGKRIINFVQQKLLNL